MYHILLTWLVTAVSLLLMTRLEIGISVNSLGTALVAGIVIGLVNAILGPILGILTLPLTIVTIGLFALVVNALLFWLAAGIVSGFRLRNGFWSALVGSILLSVINAVIFWLLERVGVA